MEIPLQFCAEADVEVACDKERHDHREVDQFSHRLDCSGLCRAVELHRPWSAQPVPSCLQHDRVTALRRIKMGSEGVKKVLRLQRFSQVKGGIAGVKGCPNSTVEQRPCFEPGAVRQEAERVTLRRITVRDRAGSGASLAGAPGIRPRTPCQRQRTPMQERPLTVRRLWSWRSRGG
jgi:hypothetical protein